MATPNKSIQEMMTSPRRWPQPVLPLKKKNNTTLDRAGLGVLIEFDGLKANEVCFMPSVLMYEPQEIVARLASKEYRIVDAWALISEGWYVD
jgi:hypothetical protein